MKIKGTRAIVTGGSQGIGRATAQALAKRGAEVWIAARNPNTLEEAAAGHKNIRTFVGDLSIIATRQALVDEVGDVDILVNNAGIGIYRTLDEITESQYRKMWELNVIAAVDLSQMVLTGMRERDNGQIVNIGSLAGYVPHKPITYYSMSKFALRAFTIGLRSELKGTGVGVSLITPGPVDTGFRKKAQLANDAAEEYTRGRGVSPDRVARAVVKSISRRNFPCYRTIAVPRIGGAARLADVPPFSAMVSGFFKPYERDEAIN